MRAARRPAAAVPPPRRHRRLAVAAPPPLPFRRGGYGCIVTDPPWDFQDQANRMRLHYPGMSDDAILALPLGELAAERAHLFCWTTDAHLELALECFRRWGFAYRRTLVWVKTLDHPAEQRRALEEALAGRITGETIRTLRRLAERVGRVRIGGGHYVRSAHELCLFGTRSLTGLVRDVPSVIMAPRGRHSAKPEELQDFAERLSPGPRLEMFARRRRPGWTCWGAECPAE